jgi:hypothetical protein
MNWRSLLNVILTAAASGAVSAVAAHLEARIARLSQDRPAPPPVQKDAD